MGKKIALVLVCLSLLWFVGACGKNTANEGASDNSQPATPGDAKAAALFKSNCVSCHGENLEGRVGPATNLQKIGDKLTKEQIAKQIAEGSKNMRAFKGKLTDEEIDALAEWLAAKK